MRVLVACEYSGRVREAFRRLGHDAWSCDLLPAEDGSEFHLQTDVLRVLAGSRETRVTVQDSPEMRARIMDALTRAGVDNPPDLALPMTYFAGVHNCPTSWDLLIAHPPCTYLARSGMRWLKDQPPLKSGKPVGAERRKLLAESIEFFETLWNAPIPRICIENPRSFLLPIPATQYIQPWQFGHGEVKTTGLWLKGLPKLVATNEVSGREAKVHKASPGPDRWKDRSRTYEGIADAMADQWGGYVDAVTLAEAA